MWKRNAQNRKVPGQEYAFPGERRPERAVGAHPFQGSKWVMVFLLFFLYNVNAVAKAPPGMAAEPAAEMQEERLKNKPDGLFFNQDLRRIVANPVIAAPNWRFGVRASAVLRHGGKDEKL